MQRHKKYLIITIWISTIAFVGAGFVGWGQYNYSDKAGAVAKVGDVEVSMGELQKSYSRLYSQYSQMFQGNFDEAKAKEFGLQKQALDQLTQQALILNLAKEYDLKVSDKELFAEIKQQDYFFKDGVFDKSIYKEILTRNNMSMNEYEQDVRKQLLIQKTLKLFPTQTSENELNMLKTIMSISDKISYKVLDPKQIAVELNEKELKSFWEEKQQNFKTEVSYEIEYIEHKKIDGTYDDATISSHYDENKNHFKDDEGKILPLKDAKDAVIEELNAKAEKKEALRTYIDYKKNQLDKTIEPKKLTISAINNPFNEEVLESVSALSITSPFLKPVISDGKYYTIQLIKTNPSRVKSFEEAKSEVQPLYLKEKKEQKLQEMAKNSVDNFKGKTTEFLRIDDAVKLDNMQMMDANEFLRELFKQKSKKGFIKLQSGKIVLYDILEQKLLENPKDLNTLADSVARLKNGMFSEGLMKSLQQKYKTEIYIEGL